MLNKATENQNNNQLTSHLHTFLSTNNCSDALKILNETNQDFPVGSALLLIACSHGKTEVVKFLLLGKQTNKEADNALKFSSMNDFAFNTDLKTSSLVKSFLNSRLVKWSNTKRWSVMMDSARL